MCSDSSPVYHRDSSKTSPLDGFPTVLSLAVSVSLSDGTSDPVGVVTGGLAGYC